VQPLFIGFKKAQDSVTREVLLNILTEFDILREIVIKMFLNETYITVRVGKHLSNMFPFRNGLKQGNALSPWLFNFAYIMPLGEFR
jgi:hypothetical protein